MSGPPSENIPVGCGEGAILRRRACGKTLGVKEAERRHFSRSRLMHAPVTRLADWPPPACPARSRCRSNLLAFHEGAHAGALDRADVHEHIPAAVARLDESKALLGVEELHGTCGHHGLLVAMS